MLAFELALLLLEDDESITTIYSARTGSNKLYSPFSFGDEGSSVYIINDIDN